MNCFSSHSDSSDRVMTGCDKNNLSEPPVCLFGLSPNDMLYLFHLFLTTAHYFASLLLENNFSPAHPPQSTHPSICPESLSGFSGDNKNPLSVEPVLSAAREPIVILNQICTQGNDLNVVP